MSLIMAEDANTQGYRAAPLARPPGDESPLLATITRRPCPRASSRAVLYVHCLQDPCVQPDLAAWYLKRGFHFYVAELRAARPRGRDATLAEYFGYLDAAVRRVREADGNRTVLVSAHRSGAIIAALWCHTRRGAAAPDALIMADPDFGPGQPWLYRLLSLFGGQPGATGTGPAGTGEARPADVLPRAQRRLRRGLDISCPVLVMNPSAVNAAAAGAGHRAALPRLGRHVTSLRLPSAPPGLARPDRAVRRRLYDELSRWLGAYLSADIRDQLL